MYYMSPDENHTSIPATISAELKVNGLERYCKLEGMDYQRLFTEANSVKVFRSIKKFFRNR